MNQRIKFGRFIDNDDKENDELIPSSSLRKNKSVLINQKKKFGRLSDMMIKKMTS